MPRRSFNFYLAAATTALLVQSAPQDAGAVIVHRYSFTTDASDSVGGAHGTVIDAGATTAAFVGGQLDLSGNAGNPSNNITEDAYVNLPNDIISGASSSGTSGAFSIELWATVSTQRTWQRFVDFGTSDGGEDTSNGGDASGYVYIAPNSGRFANGLATEFHAPGSPAEIGQNGPFTLNAQVHVVGTYNVNDTSAGVRGTGRLYLDGAEIGTGFHLPDGLNPNTMINHNNWIGRSQWPDPLFDGLFNELRIYNNAMTSAEIAASFLAGPDAGGGGGILSLEVNKTTGAVSMTNHAAAPITIDFYRIGSAAGGLKPGSWNSLDDQNYDAVDGADVGSVAGDSAGEGWDEAGGSSVNQLIEHFLGAGGSTLAANETLNLGNVFNSATFPGGADGDLTFSFGVNGGSLINSTVAYVTGGGQPGDFDSDGDVDGNDFLVWQRGFGTTHNAADLATWKANYGAGAAAAAAAVPEPATIGLLVLAGVALAAAQRKR